MHSGLEEVMIKSDASTKPGTVPPHPLPVPSSSALDDIMPEKAHPHRHHSSIHTKRDTDTLVLLKKTPKLAPNTNGTVNPTATTTTTTRSCHNGSNDRSRGRDGSGNANTSHAHSNNKGTARPTASAFVIKHTYEKYIAPLPQGHKCGIETTMDVFGSSSSSSSSSSLPLRTAEAARAGQKAKIATAVTTATAASAETRTLTPHATTTTTTETTSKTPITTNTTNATKTKSKTKITAHTTSSSSSHSSESSSTATSNSSSTSSSRKVQAYTSRIHDTKQEIEFRSKRRKASTQGHGVTHRLHGNKDIQSHTPHNLAGKKRAASEDTLPCCVKKDPLKLSPKQRRQQQQQHHQAKNFSSNKTTNSPTITDAAPPLTRSATTNGACDTQRLQDIQNTPTSFSTIPIHAGTAAVSTDIPTPTSTPTPTLATTPKLTPTRTSTSTSTPTHIHTHTATHTPTTTTTNNYLSSNHPTAHTLSEVIQNTPSSRPHYDADPLNHIQKQQSPVDHTQLAININTTNSDHRHNNNNINNQDDHNNRNCANNRDNAKDNSQVAEKSHPKKSSTVEHEVRRYPGHRVKLYTLNPDGYWGDRGTGYVSCTETADGSFLRAISESDGLVLLMSKIRRIQESFYQLQGDTIISWTGDKSSTYIAGAANYYAQVELALSFAETFGCKQIWDLICKVQNCYHSDHPDLHKSLMTGCEQDIDPSPSSLISDSHHDLDGANVVNFALQRTSDGIPLQDSPKFHPDYLNRAFPLPERRNLDSITRALSDVVISGIGRDKIISEITSRDYITKLLDLFTHSEDSQDIEGLHALYNIFRSLFLLGSLDLLETMVSEKNIFRVIGALEYDPDFYPDNRKNKIVNVHRNFVKEKVAFKPIIQVCDANVETKIHTNYRISYIKDVILPRVLDDFGFSTLTGLIHYNNNEIILYFINKRKSLEILFDILHQSARSKANVNGFSYLEHLRFLNELWNLSKTVQPQVKTSLFEILLNLGIFSVCRNALESDQEMYQIIGIDLLTSFFMHDQGLFRKFLYEQIGECDLFKCIFRTLLVGKFSGVILQVSHLLRSLLDPESMPLTAERDTFLTFFYEMILPSALEFLRSWIQDLAEQPSERDIAHETAQSQSIDLLGFFVSLHGFRSKNFVLRNNLGEKILKFLHHPATYIKLYALRFIRAIIGTKDEFYLRYLTKNKLLGPIVDLLILQKDRDNLLHSTILEMLEFSKREKLTTLLWDIMNNYSNKFTDGDNKSLKELFHSFVAVYKESNVTNGIDINSGLHSDPQKRLHVGINESPSSKKLGSLERDDEEQYFEKNDGNDEKDGKDTKDQSCA